MLASIAIIAWCKFGPWIKILGFDTYHSRGDVWLPTTPIAQAFFRAMVVDGIAMFAVVFVLMSFLVFRTIRDTPRAGFVQRIFYGASARLIVKYLLLAIVVFISPIFFNWMWHFRFTRFQRVQGASAITTAVFAALVILANLILGRRDVERREAAAASR